MALNGSDCGSVARWRDSKGELRLFLVGLAAKSLPEGADLNGTYLLPVLRCVLGQWPVLQLRFSPIGHPGSIAYLQRPLQAQAVTKLEQTVTNCDKLQQNATSCNKLNKLTNYNNL